MTTEVDLTKWRLATIGLGTFGLAQKSFSSEFAKNSLSKLSKLECGTRNVDLQNARLEKSPGRELGRLEHWPAAH